MHYFFIEGETLTADKEVSLNSGDLNHAYRVLRLKAGDEVAIADGRGAAMLGLVTGSASHKISVHLKRRLPAAESPLQIVLCQSLVKGDKMDLIVRQATELGVSKVIPLITDRSVPQPDLKQNQKKMLRLQSKIRSAAAQCRRAALPEIEVTQDLQSLLAMADNGIIIVPWEDEKEVPLFSMLEENCPEGKTVFLFVGPEGGFTEREIEAFRNAGAKIVHLGPRILRSETAAVAILTMVQATWGDLSEKGEPD